jgi:hypothetical protein
MIAGRQLVERHTTRPGDLIAVNLGSIGWFSHDAKVDRERLNALRFDQTLYEREFAPFSVNAPRSTIVLIIYIFP